MCDLWPPSLYHPLMLHSASDRANRSLFRPRRGESCKKRRSNFNRLFAQNGPFLPDGHPSERRTDAVCESVRKGLLVGNGSSCVRTIVSGGQGQPFEYGDGNLSRLMQMRLDAHRIVASERVAVPIVQFNGLTLASAPGKNRSRLSLPD